jgi:HPt (histidine-containing phosphotransfer) domain-containing protein
MPAPPRADREAATVSADVGDDTLDQQVVARLNLRGLSDPRRGERLGDLTSLFFREDEDCLVGLRDAAAAGDTSTVHQLAHTLRGSAANFGARLLPGLCEQLERRAASGVLNGAEELLDAIEAEFERVRAALRLEFPPQ